MVEADGGGCGLRAKRSDTGALGASFIGQRRELGQGLCAVMGWNDDLLRETLGH